MKGASTVSTRIPGSRMARPPLTSAEERIALFQKMFSDAIPHNKALGIRIVAVAKGLASMQLDWRIDYAKPAEPGKPVIAEAECYRITRSVAFTRAFAHQGDPKNPIAAAAGTFMLGTKGKVTRPVMAKEFLK